MSDQEFIPISKIKPNYWAILIGFLIPLSAILWYIPIFSAQLAVYKPTIIDISVTTPTYEFTWQRYWDMMFLNDAQWTRVVALGAIPNGLLFYFLLQKNKMEWAMGIFYGSLIILIILGVFRFEFLSLESFVEEISFLNLE